MHRRVVHATSSVWPFASTSEWHASVAAAHDRRQGPPRSLRSSSLPVVMRETSSRSSTSRTMCVDLALHDRARTALERLGIVVGAACRSRCRVAQRRERVAQFVGERREELVLAPVGRLQRELRFLALGDVHDGARSSPARFAAPGNAGPGDSPSAPSHLSDIPLLGLELLESRCTSCVDALGILGRAVLGVGDVGEGSPRQFALAVTGDLAEPAFTSTKRPVAISTDAMPVPSARTACENALRFPSARRRARALRARALPRLHGASPPPALCARQLPPPAAARQARRSRRCRFPAWRRLRRAGWRVPTCRAAPAEAPPAARNGEHRRSRWRESLCRSRTRAALLRRAGERNRARYARIHRPVGELCASESGDGALPSEIPAFAYAIRFDSSPRTRRWGHLRPDRLFRPWLRAMMRPLRSTMR